MNNTEFPLLENIKAPDDVKKLSNDKLNDLCCEIRKELISVVSKNGGHLASNLGVVELTVALHKSFDLPNDKIIWDVGHQAYTHKILTGRFNEFASLRTEGGISGFVRPDESKYDSFYEGHAGTSLSQASGLAAADFLKGNKNYSVTVIGDGSFGNGMVYEALNQASSVQGRLIVVLNDNEMSISENVSSLARYLAVVRAKPEYYRIKAKTEKFLNKIPLIGKKLSNFVFKIKTLIKSVVYNNSSFFEKFGFRYIGPIDGHNIESLCEAFDSAKLINKPVLIHVNTIKGKGYEFAENRPDAFHGISKFDIDTGEPVSSYENYSSVFGNTLCEFAENDKRICAVTAAMSLGTGLGKFFNQFKDRSFDVGIAEEHAVTFCSGLSAGGMIPVFAVYSTFLQRCADQLIHDGALQKKKMIIAVDRAGFVGEDGETHQGIFDVPLIQGIPNTTVYSPATYSGLRNALYNAFYKDSNLVIIRYPRGSMPEEGNELFSSGNFEIIGNKNSDISIVTYGRISFEALNALNILSQKGFSINLLKLNRIKPIPEEALNSVISKKSIFFFEEGIISGGVGEKFAESILEKGYKGKFSLTGVDNEFVKHAEVSSLLKLYKLNSESIVDKILNEVS